MKKRSRYAGLSTLVNHLTEGENPLHAHVTPIYQTATFSFPDMATGMAIEQGRQEGYIYTRVANPNSRQLAQKIAALEGWDLLQSAPVEPDKDLFHETPPEQVVDGVVFSSGMAAISTALMARLKAGDTVIAQQALYGATFNFLNAFAVQRGVKVIWVQDTSLEGWERAFAESPRPVWVYAETPVNPTMALVDIRMVAEMAHQHRSWLIVDNTFATPFCQRPLSLGADVVVHSTTKYLSGHGAIIGGAVVSPHVEYIREPLARTMHLLGGSPSPFDAWLANLGLKTFELRMRRHCDNALALARFLENHTAVARVYYPGLDSHPQRAIVHNQMSAFGGMLSFELKGGYDGCVRALDRFQVVTLGVSLGNTDSLIQHPASMTHSDVPPLERKKMGISDGLVRLSVGIENLEDLLDDFEEALSGI